LNTIDIETILEKHSITPQNVTSIIGSFSKQLFIVDKKYLVRTSLTSLEVEIEKINRIRKLKFSPKILYSGDFTNNGNKAYYVILNLLPGDDLINVFKTLTINDQKKLGIDASIFLEQLHSIIGKKYDIGHYVSTIPNYSGSWKEGHEEYWKWLKLGINQLKISKSSISIIEQALEYWDINKECLNYQNGARLLHNDFHPKNIIVNNCVFSGVIDWECSQFGEIDFEISHLIHWCLYPPQGTIDLKPFLSSFFKTNQLCIKIPELRTRLAIYEIEHDINQIIWSSGKAEERYIPRIKGWINRKVDYLFDQINY
jgi:thiamine kinase-like enzyme